MTTKGFVWYEHLSTNLSATEAFYRAVLGWTVEELSSGYHLWLSDGEPSGGLRELPSVARARGAPAHWLGHVWASDPAEAGRVAEARGAQVLGPSARTVDSVGAVALVRDPQGAVFALSDTNLGARAGFGWRELASTDNRAAWAFYEPLLGWTCAGTWELGRDLGAYLLGSSGTGGDGGIANTARLPGVHCHWAYYADVADAQRASHRVAAEGGRVVHGPFENPGGDFIAYCEDNLGAAFGLREARRR